MTVQQTVFKFFNKLMFHQKLALAVFIILLALRFMIINSPSPNVVEVDGVKKLEGGLVFDEAHYIPAVRSLLKGESVNHEHPPLSKLLIALSMMMFGDNPLGWRFFPSILSSAAVAHLPLIVWRLTQNRSHTFFTTFFIAADVMFFNIGTIAMLDGPAFFFLFLGTYLYIRRRYLFAASILGLALLSKTSTIFNIAALLLFSLVTIYHQRRKITELIYSWSPIFEKIVIVGLVVFLAGLAAYDFYYKAFNSPFAHLDYILNYHSQLRYNCSEYELPLRCTVVENDGRRVTVDLPLSWISPISPFAATPYFLAIATAGERTWHPIAYYGIYSPYWWTTALVIGFSLYYTIKSRGGDTVQTFVFTWILASYGPYFIIGHLLQRWVYTFYFLPTLPAVALGLSTVLSGDRFSRAVLYGVALVQLAWFFIYFPVKSDIHIHILELLNLPR
ncbi:MAG: glycosyltransferase family 39 protein [Candidatus Caldarchaeum sp.]|nr:glycosyltransferase family 39 protein [Candidatus Caldarchaeum sp.]